jgi:hypothetical protein
MTSVSLPIQKGAIMETKLTTYQQVLSAVYAFTIVAALVVAFLDIFIWRN